MKSTQGEAGRTLVCGFSCPEIPARSARAWVSGLETWMQRREKGPPVPFWPISGRFGRAEGTAERRRGGGLGQAAQSRPIG